MPHFVQNFVSHTKLPVYFKNLVLLGTWKLVTTFGAIGPNMVYLTLLRSLTDIYNMTSFYTMSSFCLQYFEQKKLHILQCHMVLFTNGTFSCGSLLNTITCPCDSIGMKLLLYWFFRLLMVLANRFPGEKKINDQGHFILYKVAY